ncbi:Serine/threonine-protein kinase tel1 [Oleoguttula sp. CCFEE 5521]
MVQHGKVTLQSALDRVHEGSVKTRSEALADLKHILRHNQNSSKLGGFADASFHRIYEVLFGAALTEKSTYVKAKTPALITGSTTRLAACASALKLAIDVGVQRIKLKTVRAVLDHIDSGLHLAGGDFCEPLAFDYAKCMRTLLTYQPHAEHLPAEQWERAVRLCLISIKDPQKGDDDAGATSEGGRRSTNNASYESSRSGTRTGNGTQQHQRTLFHQVAEEMLFSLRALTAAPNAPVISLASETLWGVIDFMKTGVTTSHSESSCFAVISNVLSWTQTENIDLSTKVASHLVRLLRVQWSAWNSKLSPGKQEMLITMMYLRPFLQKLISTTVATSVRGDLVALLSNMRSEYAKRLDRDRLQLDNIRLAPAGAPKSRFSIRHETIQLQCNGSRSEHNWFLISAMASITQLLTTSNTHDDASDSESDGGRRSKRQKMANQLDDLSTLCLDPDPGMHALRLKPHEASHCGFAVWESLARSHLRIVEDRELVHYLLSLPEIIESSSANKTDAFTAPGSSSKQTAGKLAAESLILSHMLKETQSAEAHWRSILQEHRSPSLEALRTLCGALVSATCASHCLAFRDGRKQSQLQEQCQRLLGNISDHLTKTATGQDEVDTCLVLLSSSLPLQDHAAHDVDGTKPSPPCANVVCAAITRAVTARRNAHEDSDTIHDDDLMDMEQDSQESRTVGTVISTLNMTDHMTAECSAAAMRIAVPLYASVRASIYAAGEGLITGDPSGAIVESILLLSIPALLAGQSVLGRLPTLPPGLNAVDAERLLDFVTEGLLRPYAYERSEVAIGLVLDVMIGLKSYWMDSTNTELYDLGLDTYNWCASTALKAGVLSPNAQRKVATLLLEICHIDTEYGRDSDTPSLWTSLFQLLKHGTITVQYHLAARISSIFERFVLARHDKLFSDLQESLPAELDATEGMAIRLLFLANLASSWHSLRRQCIYYIFETAGQAPPALPYAKTCVRKVSQNLALSSSRKLFRLFAPQLLYSWLETSSLEQLPYSAFGYDSLTHMAIDNRLEISSQVLMHGHDKELKLITQLLEVSENEVAHQAAWKSEAYAIGWDIACAAAKQEAKNEECLRKAMGSREAVSQICVSYLPAIVGQLYLCMILDDSDDAWLSKAEWCTPAAKRLAEMKKYSHSSRPLPAPQQPAFRCKQWPDQIARVLRRVRGQPPIGWDTSTFTVCARMLLDNIDDALGPSHACSVLRRLRLLVATAGDVPLIGYPLELLLRSVRPFLSESECADDALGIMQYLLHRGEDSLCRNPKLLCGIITIATLQMRRHMVEAHDSTTQETQHRETIAKMQKFSNWMIQYLQHLKPLLSEGLHADYERLIQALKHVRLPGNARKGSPESILILLVVGRRQGDVDDLLFEGQDVSTALKLLTSGFERVTTIADDALGDDEPCETYAPSLWHCATTCDLSDSFRLWTASACGRLYAATGMKDLTTPHVKEATAAATNASGSQSISSEAVIVTKLVALLSSASRIDASLVEITMRSISANLTSDGSNERLIAYQNQLPESLASAVNGGLYGYSSPSFYSEERVAPSDRTLETSLALDTKQSLQQWAQAVAVLLCSTNASHPILSALPGLLQHNADFAIEALPSILHILLVDDINRDQALKRKLSICINDHLSAEVETFREKQSFFLKLLMYLRQRSYPGESTRAERSQWLDCGYVVAARTAAACDMPSVALMLVEMTTTPLQQGNRRASTRAAVSCGIPIEVPSDLQTAIFEQMSEPDSFYGVERPASLQSVLARLDYERDGLKGLMFRSAEVDCHIRESGELNSQDAFGMVTSLSSLNLHSLTFALTRSSGSGGNSRSNELTESARHLQQWDVASSQSGTTSGARLLQVYQELSRASDRAQASASVNALTLAHAADATANGGSQSATQQWHSTLATLSEVSELVSCSNQSALEELWHTWQKRQDWTSKAAFEDVHILLENRHIAFSILARNTALREDLHIPLKDVRLYQAQALLQYSSLARAQGALQSAIGAANEVNNLAALLQPLGLDIQAASKQEVATVLWASEERATSVKMLLDIIGMPDISTSAVPIGRSGLLAQLGQQLADARLQKPSEILDTYLKPAVAQLPKAAQGAEAGTVYHTFASFCDQQLQHPANIEDFNRIVTMRQRKHDEVQELKALAKKARKSGSSDDHARQLGQSSRWLKIDEEELEKQKQSRQTYLLQSLQNYLLALQTSNDYDMCILRFFALWLENTDSVEANILVAKYIQGVPSWKFVVLMNQIMSRLQKDDSKFQEILLKLTIRMCAAHPYHAVHHVYVSTNQAAKSAAQKDPDALLRFDAALAVRQQLERANKPFFVNLFSASSSYKVLATHMLDQHERQPGKRPLSSINIAQTVARRTPNLKVPPPTIDLPLRPDGDYKSVPVIVRFEDKLQIMSGNSSPKVLTAWTSDGKQYKLLFKSGGDDLRQDAIMEQVFEGVSNMLKKHKASRKRGLKIRTYKVIPTTARSGIMEFVLNTVCINEYLRPAHDRYYPGDMKYSKATETIRSVADHSNETRVKEFRKVCDNVHPVMRHFFLERFQDPNEWFAKRTAYARTTASVSMLGHVLGLGDRHGHNIMLDEQSGEVVHIDLGIAFEAGRVLPVPELVPFRLTRDIVDGMGVTKIEGVFRRCCEFTMDAMREDKNSIMTLLNVLRYDPLYTWTLSPLRAKRMQQQQDGGQNGDAGDTAESSKKGQQDAGEADRALSVVEKKLARNLSTAATVNELIQQATDERNLATLFAGWAAWF